MAWFITIAEESAPMCRWMDKPGKYVGHLAPPEARVQSLPFYKWAGSPKVTDMTNIPNIAIQKDQRQPTDAFWIGSAGVVSKRFKDVIEDCEPGVHQFFPIVLQQKNGVPYEQEFFIFHPTGRVPCTLLSKMEGVERLKNIAGEPYYWFQDSVFVISRPAYGDRKIFSTLFLKSEALLVTDDAMERIKRARIKYLRVHPVKELDEPWIFEQEAPELAAFLKEHPDHNYHRFLNSY